MPRSQKPFQNSLLKSSDSQPKRGQEEPSKTSEWPRQPPTAWGTMQLLIYAAHDLVAKYMNHTFWMFLIAAGLVGLALATRAI